MDGAGLNHVWLDNIKELESFEYIIVVWFDVKMGEISRESKKEIGGNAN